jgi:hypothetical protein
MFLCENCGKTVERGQPINKVVTLIRNVIYNNLVKTRKIEKRYGVEIGGYWQTKGQEIIKEINTCPKCCVALTGRKPRRKVNSKPAIQHPKHKRKWNKNYKRVEQKDNRRKRPDVKIVSKLKVER